MLLASLKEEGASFINARLIFGRGKKFDSRNMAFLHEIAAQWTSPVALSSHRIMSVARSDMSQRLSAKTIKRPSGGIGFRSRENQLIAATGPVYRKAAPQDRVTSVIPGDAPWHEPLVWLGLWCGDAPCFVEHSRGRARFGPTLGGDYCCDISLAITGGACP